MPVAVSNQQSSLSPAARLSRTGKPLFFQLTDSLMLALMKTSLSGAEIRVLVVVMYHLTTYGPHAGESQRISFSTFERLTDFPRRTVGRALESLEQKGVIVVERSDGKTSRYNIAPEENWQATRDVAVPSTRDVEVPGPGTSASSNGAGPSIEKREKKKRDVTDTPNPQNVGAPDVAPADPKPSDDELSREVTETVSAALDDECDGKGHPYFCSCKADIVLDDGTRIRKPPAVLAEVA